ncbi:hypothetical protein BH11PSE1_BH11PSE1_28430 [soil metagenome]
MTDVLPKTLALRFADAITRTREALTAEGFGVITAIDVQKTLKDELGVQFRPYLILGACNPALAHEAFKLAFNVGAMLPCNVVVQDAGDGRTDVSAIGLSPPCRRSKT